MKHFKAPSKSQRKSMPKRCFLKPRAKKYPVCGPVAKKPTCEGTLAARRRALLNRDRTIANAAVRLAKRMGCPWAKGTK